MSFTKVIYTGTHIEHYTYEKSPRPVLNRKPRIRKEADSFGSDAAKSRRLDNIKRTRKRFIQLVSSNTTRAGAPALLTLTMRSVIPIEEANVYFGYFFTQVRKYVASDLCYVGVPEFQKRGAVHYHVLVWGFSDETIKTERDTRLLQHLWARGFLDCAPTDGSAKLAGYLAKYMSKAMHDERLSGKRSYFVSRNALRPKLYGTALPVVYSREVLGVDIELLTSRSFETDWLGRCDYKLYKVKDYEGVPD